MDAPTLAAKLIRHFEGCKLMAYQDTGGVWTIGVGHTKDVTPGQVCTQEQADAWLLEDIAPLIKETSDLPVLKAVAYIDFGYNCGLGALRKLIAGQIYLSSYGRRDRQGHELPGLVARRNTEQALVAMEG